MPREILTDPAPDDGRPVAGFFGKLPSTGDFVARGLPDAFRRSWDAWITRHLAPLQREGTAFPEGGLRFQLFSGGRTAAGMILPSSDSAGRHFPLSVMLVTDGGLTRSGIDAWCDAALGLLVDDRSADDLWHALDTLAAPRRAEPPAVPLLLWTADHPQVVATPDQPDEAIRRLLA